MKTNEMKHTKGQWHFRTGMSDNYCEIIGDYKTNKVIAVTPKDCFVNKEEAEANGRLIAATPDLLDMLTRIYNIENHAFTLKGFDVVRLKLEIKNVIKKATT